MTHGQLTWEAWFQAFTTIRDAWPEQVTVACPNADHGRVRVAYAGDPGRRVGIAYVWCDSCRQGIYLTRVGIPNGAAVVDFDASDEELAAVVPADIEFLPADPAPPADPEGRG